MGLGFDVIDRVALSELRKWNTGYRRPVDQRSRLAQNAVDENRVIGGYGQIAMRLKGLPPPPLKIQPQSEWE